MGKNFQEAQDALALWIGADNAKRFDPAVRGDIINMVRRDLSRLHDLRFNEVSTPLNTTANVKSYTLPSGWSRPYTLTYINPTTGALVELEYEPNKQAFDRRFPTATLTGSPSVYNVWAGQLHFGRTPDAIYAITVNYFRILPDLAGSQTDDLMDQAWETVHFKALVEATPYLLEDERMPTWMAKAKEKEDLLIIEHARGRTSGRRPVSQEPG